MLATKSACAPTGDERSKKIERRVNRALEQFQILPDAALIEIRVVSALLGRSRASVYRDVKDGRLAPPVHISRSSRWRVGDVRAALTEGARDVA